MIQCYLQSDLSLSFWESKEVSDQDIGPMFVWVLKDPSKNNKCFALFAWTVPKEYKCILPSEAILYLIVVLSSCRDAAAKVLMKVIQFHIKEKKIVPVTKNPPTQRFQNASLGKFILPNSLTYVESCYLRQSLV